MFCYLLTKAKVFTLEQYNYDNTFLSIIRCSVCEKSETISFGSCNIIVVAQQNINVILSMCNIYKQSLHCYTPNS